MNDRIRPPEGDLFDHAIVGKNAPIQDPVSCEIPMQTLLTSPDVSATIQGAVKTLDSAGAPS